MQDLIEAKGSVVTETIDAQASQVKEETNAVNDACSENTMIYSALQGDCSICFDTFVGRSEDQGACNAGCPRNTSEETVDVPAPQIQGQSVEVVETTPRERVSERDVEQIVDVPVPQVVEETMEVMQSVPREQIQEHSLEAIVEVIQLVPRRHVQECIVEESVDVPVSYVMEEITEVMKLTPRAQFIDKAMDLPIAQWRQTPTVQTALKAAQPPQVQSLCTRMLTCPW